MKPRFSEKLVFVEHIIRYHWINEAFMTEKKNKVSYQILCVNRFLKLVSTLRLVKVHINWILHVEIIISAGSSLKG